MGDLNYLVPRLDALWKKSLVPRGSLEWGYTSSNRFNCRPIGICSPTITRGNMEFIGVSPGRVRFMTEGPAYFHLLSLSCIVTGKLVHHSYKCIDLLTKRIIFNNEEGLKCRLYAIPWISDSSKQIKVNFYRQMGDRYKWPLVRNRRCSLYKTSTKV